MARFDADRWVSRGLKSERKGDRVAAEALYREVIGRRPEHAGARAQLGGLLAQDGHVDEAIAHLEVAERHLPTDASVANNLGHLYREVGRLDEAEARFSRVAAELGAPGHYGVGTVRRERGDLEGARQAFGAALRADPDFAHARDALATVEELAGRPAEAIRLLTEALARHGARPQLRRRLGVLHAFHGRAPVARAMLAGALQEDPSDPVAQHMLAALDGRAPDQPAPGFVSELFDAFAAGYDTYLRDVLQTRVPELVEGALDGSCGSLLDLGCGSGMALFPLRHRVERAVGVDLSLGMVRSARATGLYEAVHHAGIPEWLAAADTGFDTVIAADVLVYLGALEAVFEGVARVCTGRFVFTVESLEDGEYSLLPTGRYAHSRRYLEACARDAGLELVRCEPEPLRREGEGWVQGFVGVARPGV